MNGSFTVLLAIARECGNGEATEMSMPEIGRMARLSERSVRNAVKELAGLGELSVTERSGGRHCYSLCMTIERPVSTTPAKSAGVPRQNLPGSTPAKSAGVSDHPQSSNQVNGTTPAKSAGVRISDVCNTTTGRSKAEVKDVPAKPPRLPGRPDVEHLCEHLAARIEANGSKRPGITSKWRDAARLMLDKDGRTEQQVKTAIDWCQDHEFWRSNILSMPKLREKYDQLRLQATRQQNGRPSRQQETDDLFNRAMQRAQEKEREEAQGNDPNRNGHANPLHQSALPPAAD